MTLSPGLSPNVDVSPATFAAIKTLCDKAWLVKNRYDTCHGGYASQLEDS